MKRVASHKQEILKLERGGRYAERPAKVFTTSEFRLEREMVSAFAAIHGEDGTVPSKGIYSIRAGDQKPWRTLARRFIEARRAGAPREQLRGVLAVFEVWLNELYQDESPDKAA